LLIGQTRWGLTLPIAFSIVEIFGSLVILFVCVCGTGVWLMAFTLNHSTSPLFMKVFFKQGLLNYLSGPASNHKPPDLCLLSS
jgi:hypothetical protein